MHSEQLSSTNKSQEIISEPEFRLEARRVVVRQFSMWIQNQKVSEARLENSNHYGGPFRQPKLKKVEEKRARLELGAEGTQHPLGSSLPSPFHLHSH